MSRLRGQPSQPDPRLVSAIDVGEQRVGRVDDQRSGDPLVELGFVFAALDQGALLGRRREAALVRDQQEGVTLAPEVALCATVDEPPAFALVLGELPLQNLGNGWLDAVHDVGANFVPEFRRRHELIVSGVIRANQ